MAPVILVAKAIVHAFRGDVDADAYLNFELTRLGLDRRYCNDDAKLRALGWAPQGRLYGDLPDIVARERKTWRW